MAWAAFMWWQLLFFSGCMETGKNINFHIFLLFHWHRVIWDRKLEKMVTLHAYVHPCNPSADPVTIWRYKLWFHSKYSFHARGNLKGFKLPCLVFLATLNVPLIFSGPKKWEKQGYLETIWCSFLPGFSSFHPIFLLWWASTGTSTGKEAALCD